MNLAKSFFSGLLCFYLIIFLVIFPAAQTVHAAQVPTIAVVEIVNDKPNKDVGRIRQVIEKQLSASGQVQMISHDRVASYFQNQHLSTEQAVLLTERTDGDNLYQQGEDLFMDFKNNESLVVLEQAKAKLKQQPGIRSSLLKAYLIETQIYWEAGKNRDAQSALMQAAELNLDSMKMDDFMWSPDVQAGLRNARSRFLAQNKVAELVIQVKGNKSSPIFVNGILRGNGPRLSLKIATNTQQIVAVGLNPKSGTSTWGGEISLADKGASFQNVAGVKRDYAPQLQSQVIQMGRALGANLVLAIGTKGTAPSQLFEYVVYDVNKDTVIRGDLISSNDLQQANVQLSQTASQSVLSPTYKPTTNAYITKEPYFPTTSTTLSAKQGKSNTWIFVVAGVVIAGAGAALALSLGGSSNDSSSHTTAVDVAGPSAETP